MKVCGLDFETANSCSGSICSVGVAVVEIEEVLERKEYLIKPHKSLDWMSKFCRDIHGITYEDLRESPEFSEVWQSVKTMLTSADCVVIHNAPFDLRHLHNILSLYHYHQFHLIMYAVYNSADTISRMHILTVWIAWQICLA